MNQSAVDPKGRAPSCVVTGAAHGIGRATTMELQGNGWFVVGVDSDNEALLQLKEDLAGEVTTVAGDVRSKETLELASDLASRANRLCGWVNNAAVFHMGRLDEMDEEAIRESVAVNLVAVVLGCAVAGAKMIHSGTRGSIVNVSSIQAHQVLRGFSLYAATKAGVEGATFGAAVDYGPYGIRVNAVAPGTIWTERTAPGMPKGEMEALKETIGSTHASGRVGEAREVATVIAFLLSDAASNVTGAVVPIDGGRSAFLPGES